MRTLAGFNTDVGSTCQASLWVFNSFAFFWMINRLLKFRLQCAGSYDDSSSCASTWLLKNTMVSFCHALITGLWSISCIIGTPEMVADLIVNHSAYSNAMIAVSCGYFIFDLLDYVVHDGIRKDPGTMAHHVVVIFCFCVVLTSHRYIGFAVVSLLVEVNSTFLHLRQALLLQGENKASLGFRAVMAVNLFTFLVFRMGTFGYLLSWHHQNFDRIPTAFSITGAVAMIVLAGMSTVLLFRVVLQDFFEQAPIQPMQKPAKLLM